MPALDAAILEDWARRPDFSFWSQDEDLFLAEPSNFELVTEMVQRPELDKLKRAALLSALCVLVYENTPDADSDAWPGGTAATTAIAAVTFLSEHQDLFDEAAEMYAYDYIKVKVYPMIGRQLPG